MKILFRVSFSLGNLADFIACELPSEGLSLEGKNVGFYNNNTTTFVSFFGLTSGKSNETSAILNYDSRVVIFAIF